MATIFTASAVAGGVIIFGSIGFVAWIPWIRPAMALAAALLAIRAGLWHWRRLRRFRLDRYQVQAHRNRAGSGWLGTVYFGWILGTSLFTQMMTPLVQAIAVLAAALGVWFGISVGVGMGLARSVPPWAGAFSRNDLPPTEVIRRFASRAHGFRVAGLTMALVLLVCAAVAALDVYFSGRQETLAAQFPDCVAHGHQRAVARSASLLFVTGTYLDGPVMSATHIDGTSLHWRWRRERVTDVTVTAVRRIVSGTAATPVVWAPSVNSAESELAYIEGSRSHVGSVNGEGNVMLSNSYGSDRSVLLRSGTGYSPVVSPNGKFIAVVNDGIVLLLNRSGGPVRALSSPGDVESISWSSNGNCIAESVKYVNRIAIIDIGTNRYSWLTPQGAGAYYPAWSPERDDVAYSTDSGALVETDLATGVTRELVPCQQATCDENWQPEWSPDGSLLAFTRTSGDNGTDQVFIVPSTGGKPLQVTYGPDQHAYPAW